MRSMMGWDTIFTVGETLSSRDSFLRKSHGSTSLALPIGCDGSPESGPAGTAICPFISSWSKRKAIDVACSAMRSSREVPMPWPGGDWCEIDG